MFLVRTEVLILFASSLAKKTKVLTTNQSFYRKSKGLRPLCLRRSAEAKPLYLRSFSVLYNYAGEVIYGLITGIHSQRIALELWL